MTRQSARRSLALVVGLLGVCAAGFALTGQPTGVPRPTSEAASPAASDVIQPAALFDVRCGRCHDAGTLAGRLRTDPDPQARRRAFADVLASHGGATRVENDAILDWLAAGPGGGH